MAAFLKALVLALLLLPVALGAQEAGHVAAYSFFGVPASLVVTPWRLHSVDLQIFGLHAAPAQVPSVPVHVLVDFLGPALVVLPLVLLGLAAPAGPARAALLAVGMVMLFFTVILTSFALGEFWLGQDMDVLLIPELNYGPALLILVAVCAAVAPARASRGVEPRPDC